MYLNKKNTGISIGILLLIILSLMFYQKEKFNDDSIIIKEDSIPLLITREYGLLLDTFLVEEKKVKNGENFSVLMKKTGISGQLTDKLVKESANVFSIKKIVAGNTYKILLSKNQEHIPHYFIYEQDYENYVVFQLSGENKIYTGRKEIEIKIKTLSSSIQSSLYNAMTESGISPSLAIDLADIFECTVDFFGIQKGDNLKLIYEEKLLKGKQVGYGKILTASFFTSGENNYAFHFEQDGRRGYFDEKGKSLRRSLLKAPLQFTRISSRFNIHRFHPVLERFKPHLGTDYAAPIGTPVISVGDGTILEAQYKLNNGNYVKIKHNSTYTTGYLHLSRIAKGIKAGVKVKQGQLIGYVGSTGLATGPHLCYRFWKNGIQVDALKIKIPPSEPIEEKFLTAFDEQKTEMMDMLNQN